MTCLLSDKIRVDVCSQHDCRVCHNLDREKNRKFESRSLAVEFKLDKISFRILSSV